MFNSELKEKIRSIESDYKDLRDKYWKLSAKHDRLLAYLGVYEESICKVEIVKKGGPEKP